METLLAKLSEQSSVLKRQKAALSTGSDDENIQPQGGSSSNSTLFTPASEAHSNAQNTRDRDTAAHGEAAEVARLKKELEDAKDRIARQTQELSQSRVIKQTLEQTMSSASDIGLSPTMSHLSGAYTGLPRQGWANNDDARSEVSDFNGPPSIWAGPTRPMVNHAMQSDSAWGFGGVRPFNQRSAANVGPMLMSQQQQPQQRNYSVPLSPGNSASGRGISEFNPFGNGRGYGGFTSQHSRAAQGFGPRSNNYDMYSGSNPASSAESINLGGMNPGSAYQNMSMYQGYQPQPIGTPLSPTANEFRSGQGPSNPWNAAVRNRILPTFSTSH